MTRCCVVGIAGPSCAGKTALAEALAARLVDAVVIGLDRYYNDLGHLPPDARAQQDFDHPDALEWARLVGDLGALCSGLPVRVPCYDFEIHARRPEGEVLLPRRYVIIEGIHALYHPDVYRRYLLGVYVDAPQMLCRARRVHRDVAARGRRRDSVERQFRDTVWPAYMRYVAPARAHAGLVLEGDQPLLNNVERVVQSLGRETTDEQA